MAYNMSMVEVFAKKSHFSRLIVKNASLTLPSFTCRVNWDSELKTNYSQTRFDAKNPMLISYLANEFSLKIIFFEISLIVSICMKFKLLHIWGSVLKIEHTPRLVLTIKV